MYLQEGQPDSEQRIAERNARVGERSRVENQEPDAIGGGSVDAADQLGLRIALKSHQLVAGLPGQLSRALFNRLESVGPVDAGLATAQQVEIRSVEKQY